MRNIVYKNITSYDRKKKVLSSAEFNQENGIQSKVYRHLICKITDINHTQAVLPGPQLYVAKKRDTRLKNEVFYCRIKGSLYLPRGEKFYLITYIHSLRITLSPARKVHLV